MHTHQNPAWVQGAKYGVHSKQGLLYKPPAFGGRKSCDCVEKALYNTDVPEYPAHEYICLRHCVKGFVTQSHHYRRTKEARTQSAVKARAINRFAFGSEMLITECSIMLENAEEGKYAFLKNGDIVAEDISYRSTNVSCVYKVPMGYSSEAFLENVTENKGLAQTFFPGPIELIPFPDDDTVQPASRHLAPESDVRNNQPLLDANEAATVRYNQMQLVKRKNKNSSSSVLHRQVPAPRPKKTQARRSRKLPASAGAGRVFTAPSTVAGPSSTSVPAVGAVPSVPAAAPFVPAAAPFVPAAAPFVPAAAPFVPAAAPFVPAAAPFVPAAAPFVPAAAPFVPAAAPLVPAAVPSVPAAAPADPRYSQLMQSTAVDYSTSMYAPLSDVQAGPYLSSVPSEPALDLQQNPVADDNMLMDTPLSAHFLHIELNMDPPAPTTPSVPSTENGPIEGNSSAGLLGLSNDYMSEEDLLALIRATYGSPGRSAICPPEQGEASGQAQPVMPVFAETTPTGVETAEPVHPAGSPKHSDTEVMPGNYELASTAMPGNYQPSGAVLPSDSQAELYYPTYPSEPVGGVQQPLTINPKLLVLPAAPQ